VNTECECELSQFSGTHTDPEQVLAPIDAGHICIEGVRRRVSTPKDDSHGIAIGYEMAILNIMTIMISRTTCLSSSLTVDILRYPTS
jgi:hypothetical protein